MLSRRSRWDAPMNRLASVRETLRGRGEPVVDLTESNPTRAGIAYPADQLAGILSDGAKAPYDPDPRGTSSAREALAAELSTPADRVDPGDLVLTASTSEAYSFLFKLLGDPGDEIVTHTPSYPLLDYLADLELLRLRRFPLHFHGRRWEVESSSVAAVLSDRSRAIVVVHPNNPTGSALTEGEQEAIASLAAPRQLAVISDEVFLPYPLDPAVSLRSFGSRDDVLSFSLGGLSKSAGLPHWKLGWIRVAGPAGARREALAGLELIADSFLSVATPVQSQLGRVLEAARAIRGAILERIRVNEAALREIAASVPAIRALPLEGGWTAVLRVPTLLSDEELAVRLLEDAHVLVHPGYFFDFAAEGFVVVSLLAPPAELREGATRLVRFVAELIR